MRNQKLKSGMIVVVGILFTAVFCFVVNGLHLDEEFEMSDTNPSPSVIQLYDVGDTTGKININTADANELDKLNGVGEKMAQRIIDYREHHGAFKQIQDIMKVQGIGKKTFEDMKDSICVSSGK